VTMTSTHAQGSIQTNAFQTQRSTAVWTTSICYTQNVPAEGAVKASLAGQISTAAHAAAAAAATYAPPISFRVARVAQFARRTQPYRHFCYNRSKQVVKCVGKCLNEVAIHVDW
jgi:hypothetical protein